MTRDDDAHAPAPAIRRRPAPVSNSQRSRLRCGILMAHEFGVRHPGLQEFSTSSISLPGATRTHPRRRTGHGRRVERLAAVPRVANT